MVGTGFCSASKAPGRVPVRYLIVAVLASHAACDPLQKGLLSYLPHLHKVI
jgi:hypothetical protein